MPLGEGAYSSVFKVKRYSDGGIYALKKVKLPKLTYKGFCSSCVLFIVLTEKENALNEVRILASIKDPYIIGYKEAFYDEDSSCLCIIMEYAGGGDIL